MSDFTVTKMTEVDIKRGHEQEAFKQAANVFFRGIAIVGIGLFDNRDEMLADPERDKQEDGDDNYQVDVTITFKKMDTVDV